MSQNSSDNLPLIIQTIIIAYMHAVCRGGGGDVLYYNRDKCHKGTLSRVSLVFLGYVICVFGIF